jgi:hypothetical protein
VRRPAGDDERAEHDEQKREWDVAALADEVEEGGRDREVRDRDQRVGDDVQRHERRLPRIAVPVRQEIPPEQALHEIRHGCGPLPGPIPQRRRRAPARRRGTASRGGPRARGGATTSHQHQ